MDSEKLNRVEARVGTGHEEPVHRIVSTTRKFPLSHLVVARIFVKETGKDSRGHIRANTIIGKRLAVAFRIGIPSLALGFRIIFCLGDSGKGTVEGKSGPIKHARRGEPEFLSAGERRKSLGACYKAIIWQHLEDAIVFGSCFLFQLTFADCLICLGNGWIVVGVFAA